ncbi:DUF6193 family natural product biosynthesis protein, partial [Streptomyces sp. NPDC127084]|uniref:DUF6193 family natural product biosynthesis protein n=1 Tax=Streptomyces sp. NPDC127084 TaxID=3347133 RepID=UPI0036463E05
MHNDPRHQSSTSNPARSTVDLAHYPELSRDAADPAAALQRIAAESGFDLTGLRTVDSGSASPGPVVLELASDRGWAQLTIQREHRDIRLELSAPGLRVAWGNVADLKTVAEMVGAWQNGATVSDMQERWTSLEVNPLAVAHEAGEAVEYQWRTLLALPVGTYGAALARTASEVPQLRALFPVVSHGKIEFSRCTLPPYSHDIPSVLPTSAGTWRVQYPSSTGTPPVDAATIEEAMTLVVRGLPEGCGPAVQGRGRQGS